MTEYARRKIQEQLEDEKHFEENFAKAEKKFAKTMKALDDLHILYDFKYVYNDAGHKRGLSITIIEQGKDWYVGELGIDYFEADYEYEPKPIYIKKKGE